MRPVLTILFAVVLMSGIFAYTQFAERVRPEPVQYQADFSDSKYVVRLNRTFDCAGNPEFGLENSLVILFKDQKIARTEAVPASEKIEFELPEVEIGRNSIFVEAYVPNQFDSFDEPTFDSFDVRSAAMQIELLRDGVVIAEQTFWIEPGLNSVSGSLSFEIEDEQLSEDED